MSTTSSGRTDDVEPAPSDDSQNDEDDHDGNSGGVPLPLPPPSSTKLPPRPNPPNQTNQTSHSHGLQRAKQREQVRQAARRGVAFGFPITTDDGSGVEGKDTDKGRGGGEGGEGRRKVDAVQGGRVVEASFAKGEWGVRWRE